MRTVQFSKPVLYIFIVIILSTLVLKNGVYWLCSFAVLFFIINKLWRPFTPGIFVFCMLFQWLQVFATVGFCTFIDKPVDFRSPHNGIAIIWSLIGLMVVTLGIKKMVDGYKGTSFQAMFASGKFISPRKVLLLYIIFYFVGTIIQKSAFGLSGLTQILFSIFQMKWVFYMIYAYLMLLGQANKRHFIVIFIFEFLSGFYSYFSSFKEPIFYFLIVYISFIQSVDMKKFLRTMLLGLFLGGMFLIWTNVKSSYRDYLNGQSKLQTIEVSQGEAYGKLTDLVSKGMTKEEFDWALVTSLFRLEYTYHFAVVMDRVPSLIPHEYGSLLLSSLMFVTTPRFLNPDKGQLDASAKTTKYTGILYAGVDKGVSISMGYFVECYIDFGYIGMFLPLYLIGLWIGFIFLYFAREKGMNTLLAFALSSSIIIHFQAFETDSIIIFGRTLINFAIFAILMKYFLPIITSYLRE